MRPLTPRERVLVGAAAGAAVLFLASWLVIIPWVRSEASLGGRIEERRLFLADLESVVAREGGLRERDIVLDEELAKFDGLLLPGDTPPLAAAELQTRIKDLADRAGLKIVSEKILDHREKGTFLEIPVQVTGSGDIANLRDFVVLLESAPVAMDIEELRLRTVKRKNFDAATRKYVEVSEIQATVTVSAVLPAPPQPEEEEG